MLYTYNRICNNNKLKSNKQYKKKIKNKKASDHERIAKEQKEVTDLFDMLGVVYYFSSNKAYNLSSINVDFLERMRKYAPSRKSEDEKTEGFDACQVCFSTFDQKQCKLVQMQEHCNHAIICEECFKRYLQSKIKDEDVLPWLCCPTPNCFQPIFSQLLCATLEKEDLSKFAKSFLLKHLTRNPNWIKCKNTKDCQYGFVLFKEEKDEIQKKCECCELVQTVSRNPIKSDQGFQELLKSGVLRLCPKCQFPTMKDKGLCNVMQCGQCGIWWNWRTYEFGNSSRDLKNKARSYGTLWEPGELEYQQGLQREKPEEFKKLLERNGIPYDPNYVRDGKLGCCRSISKNTSFIKFSFLFRTRVFHKKTSIIFSEVFCLVGMSAKF
ncbi:hypothetical protein RFI_31597 [Reticulomyxa filosa]|uniref:RING-type domain-containing protein n=1 Tax=Reticulomyxa filosa TaxID=46433 RepID=X6LV44_RETFI|nr:hypothetical protein RFI_31597 [Reticulomyxa filosa]|eukprot:ETO05798.1 hypothetical protein RFI_31597 [Reticulomyxa filosa]